MEWVHCNHCYIQPSPNNKDIIFSLTSCGHIFCSSCIKNKDKFCFVCKSSCNLMPLTNNLPQNVMIYFTNPISLIDKFESQFQQVLQFQHKNRTNLLKHALQEIQTKAEDRRKEIAALEKENALLKSQLGSDGNIQHVQHVPMNTTPSPHFPPPPSLTFNQATPTNNTLGATSLRRPHPPTALTTPHNKKMLISSSPRMTTPSPSPSSTSGNSSLRTPNSVKGSLITKDRLCLRTPPIDGRMGVIPRYGGQRSNSLPQSLISTPLLSSRTALRSNNNNNNISIMGPPSFTPNITRRVPTPLSNNYSRPYPQNNLSRPNHPSLPPYPPFSPNTTRTHMRSPIASPMINNIKL